MKINIFHRLITISLVFTFIFCISGCSDKDNEEPQNNPNTNQSPGVSATDFLSSENYDQLIVEIQYTTGFEPPQQAVSNLRSFLESILNKPSGISIVTTEIAAPGQSSYTIADIQAIEDNNRTEFYEGKTIAAYFVLLDGGYSKDTGNSKVLGVAYRNTSMALFQKTIEDHSGGLGQPSTSLLTSTVINHEFGHILGLVNNGTPLQTEHQDTAHGKHCNVEGCLMYWTAETNQGIADLLGMSAPPSLDAQCLADLKANGGK
ncbi:Membrane metalloprotease [Fulvivirga imtechensis AK7]|uniref:Membrane metalloprotease n=1 Tax=Fulvivirga imtechensis AK7 TaxID=1237149 RepID=L8JIJ9_9BACT|nr:hypothetical protein [Fulvivirga imtechensis]ELR68088.1 Membrane metalloprotease [Fulvivirga imtechensis AK7]